MAEMIDLPYDAIKINAQGEVEKIKHPCRVCGNTETCFLPGPNVWICDKCMKKIDLAIFEETIKRINEPERQAVA